MLVKCIYNSGKHLPLDSRVLNESDETDYSFLTIGEELVVYGLMFFSTRVDYLVCLNGSKPIWLPSNLFKILNNELPKNWSLCVTSLDEQFKILYETMKIVSMVSYPKLVNSFVHYIGIIERESEELATFFIEKDVIDNEIEIKVFQ